MIVTRNISIYSKNIDGKWIILERNKEHTRELNEVAGLVWEYTQKAIDTTEIAQKIATQFNIEYSIALKDVESFVKSYIKDGFLKVV